MQTQTIFQVGNSNAVTIPQHLMKELNLKKGQDVIVDRLTDTDAIIITSKSKSTTPKLAENEYQKWLTSFFKEDGDLLNELATR
jgi:putative addiction module antidote